MEEQTDNFEREEQTEEGLFPAVKISELAKEGNNLVNKVIEENDPQKLEELTKLFALNQRKKQIARTNKLSNLLELVDDEVIHRVTTLPDAIENRDLLNYWKTTQESINQGNSNDQELPKVQINNQTNVNISSSGLDRDSRARVLEAVQEILKDSLQNNQGNDIIDIIPERK